MPIGNSERKIRQGEDSAVVTTDEWRGLLTAMVRETRGGAPSSDLARRRYASLVSRLGRA